MWEAQADKARVAHLEELESLEVVAGDNVHVLASCQSWCHRL